MEKLVIFPFSDLRLETELNMLVSASIIEATFGQKFCLNAAVRVSRTAPRI